MALQSILFKVRIVVLNPVIENQLTKKAQSSIRTREEGSAISANSAPLKAFFAIISTPSGTSYRPESRSFTFFGGKHKRAF